MKLSGSKLFKTLLFAGNAASIFLLTRKELQSFFNQLLAMLCTFDMVYLLTMFLEALRNLGLETPTHIIVFSYFLYPVNAIAMMGSIYMTMVVGLERSVMKQLISICTLLEPNLLKKGSMTSEF